MMRFFASAVAGGFAARGNLSQYHAELEPVCMQVTWMTSRDKK